MFFPGFSSPLSTRRFLLPLRFPSVLCVSALSFSFPHCSLLPTHHSPVPRDESHDPSRRPRHPPPPPNRHTPQSSRRNQPPHAPGNHPHPPPRLRRYRSHHQRPSL